MEITVDGGGSLGRVAGRSPGGWWPPRLTWDLLVQLEPRLALAEATVAPPGRRAWASRCKTIRTTVAALVGWDSPHAGHPVLGSSTSHDVAFDHLMDVAGCRRRGR